MPDKSLRMRRAGGEGLVKRPAMLAIAGDARSEPRAIAQLLLLYHLTDAAR